MQGQWTRAVAASVALSLGLGDSAAAESIEGIGYGLFRQSSLRWKMALIRLRPLIWMGALLSVFAPTFASAEVLRITCDDQVDALYIDGVEVTPLGGNASSYGDVDDYSVSLTSGPHVFAFQGSDQADLAMCVWALYSDDLSQVTSVSDPSNTKVVGTMPTGAWTSVGYDDSGWATPTDCSTAMGLGSGYSPPWEAFGPLWGLEFVQTTGAKYLWSNASCRLGEGWFRHQFVVPEQASLTVSEPAGINFGAAVTPQGTSAAHPAGTPVTVTLTGPMGAAGSCSGVVTADGSWACTTAIIGLDPATTYMVMASSSLAADTEMFSTSACFDEVDPPGTDKGCSAVAPSCDASTFTCGACTENSHCGGATPFCNTATLVCAACLSAADCNDGNACTADACTSGTCSRTPVAAGTSCGGGVCNGAATMCVTCIDNASAGMTDSGCGGSTRICNDSAAMPVCAQCEVNADCSGGAICVGSGATAMCTSLSISLATPVDGSVLANPSTTPSGTTGGAPNGSVVTVTVTGPGGPFSCTAVVSSGAWTCTTSVSGLTPGEDYTATARVTVSSSTVMDANSFTVAPCAGRMTGDACSDQRGTSSTTGVCSADGAAGVCVSCADTQTGAASDAGCMASAPLCRSLSGTPTCVACIDDRAGGTDLGCSGSASGPVCNASNPASAVCVACEDNAGVAMMDNGCGMSGSPICRTVDAPTCVQCTVDGDCMSGTVCGSANTCVPGCNTDVDCSGTPNTPVCNTAMRECVACLVDAHCQGIEQCTSTRECALPDRDMDGVRDDTDIDDDNDGILDTDEFQGDDLSLDRDADGVPDYLDVDLQTCSDSTSDGMCDEVPSAFDFDGDGIANHLDLDADGDGLSDVFEGLGQDSNGDGEQDGFVDVNGNGYADALEATPLVVPNTDAQGLPDFLDVDADGDGLTDTHEASGVDADGDGRPDNAGQDGDADGWADSFLGNVLAAPDQDGDGARDYRDTDTDGDGLTDFLEAFDGNEDGEADLAPRNADRDGDGLDDSFDPNCTGAICGGVLGRTAPEPDTDGDGLANWRDLDNDGDGIADGFECNVPSMCSDSDADGLPDYLELDADADSVADGIEGHDANHDGVADVNPIGADSNGNGLDDAYDGACTEAQPCGGVVGVVAPRPDFDSDGRPNYQDVDDDADGIATFQEVSDADEYVGPATNGADVDGDGANNWYDVDSDGDSARDMSEESRPALNGDVDGNGILDYLDPNFAPQDTDGDGVIDAVECPGVNPPTDACVDSDQDGVPNYQDVDDDNDGILTSEEYAAPDAEDGEPSNDHDFDEDGLPNHLDIDADNDGIPDVRENGHGDLDANHDGRVDSPVDQDGDGLLASFDVDDANADNVMAHPAVNTDTSGGGDYVDLDADGDGLLDIFEADGVDTNGDGIIDEAMRADANSDGFADLVAASPWPTPDSDGADADDFQDTDSDDDGIADAVEGVDVNGDGVAEVLATGVDANGNGIDDAYEGDPTLPPDHDGDGALDFRDTDDDGDGIHTVEEHPGMGNAMDSDGDRTPDYLDVEDDGDGVNTRFEAPDANGDGVPDDARDTDADGTPDYLDGDDDEDGIRTRDEGPDPNGDGNPADAADSDNDGTPDYLDVAGIPGAYSGGALCSASSVGWPAMLTWIALASLLARRRRR